MTYQQSLELIEKLKNIVWPYTKEWFVFLDFKAETEFEIRFIEVAQNPSMVKYILEKDKAGLPYVVIYMFDSDADDIPVFYYYDARAIHYRCNLITGEILMSDVEGQTRHCPIQMKLEMGRLIRQLKNT